MIQVIECNCFLINKSLQELGVDNQEDVPARFSFRTDSVESIREILDKDGEIMKDQCLVYFKSFASATVDMGYDELRPLVFGSSMDDKFTNIKPSGV